ncbi:MAG: hypothetical protein K8S00_09140 [Bacteroidales bacterium]|nr:hypothetical protein [Bacteroidales bacterium]
MVWLKKFTFRFLIILVLLYAILLIPEPSGEVIGISSESAFLWNQDEKWDYLEEVFQQAKEQDTTTLNAYISLLIFSLEDRLDHLKDTIFLPGNEEFEGLLPDFFSITPLIAVNHKHIDWFLDYYNRVRMMIKEQSRNWDMESEQGRVTVYKNLYGMRAAVEEVLLQISGRSFQAALLVNDEASLTPATDILGIKVHSGDLLVSRGGAPVSALISRGNDYPGNFSHVAMIYIDPDNNIPYLVESHIERGVAIASVEEYIKDTKLRFMVLRPRANLPEILEDPEIPHKAALYIYEEALSRHIPYDFKMNFNDPSKMFCSEVGSIAYKKFGIQLWKPVSTISSPGIINWLHAFGVENFVTQMPSDLEYDPQLTAVAEWRDPETLFKDHIDNAVMDVLLESANSGEKIKYNIWLLPPIRVLKAYCMLLNLFSIECIIPEGMSATKALKNQDFEKRFENTKKETEILAGKFIEEKGYTPPYWQLVRLAEKAKDGR